MISRLTRTHATKQETKAFNETHTATFHFKFMDKGVDE